MIFDAFESIKYGDEKIEVVDIIRDYRSYIDRVVQNYTLMDFTIVGDPTPEYTAYQLYGNPNLYWIFLYLNSWIVDPFHGWVKSQDAVFETAKQKYSKMGGIEQVLYHMDHNFETYYDLVEYPENSEIWYHKGDKKHSSIQHVGYLHPVSVYEHEEMENDKKRVIKIIKQSDINSFLNALGREIDRSIKGGV